MLHIVNKSHSQTRMLESCLRLARDGQALLLIEDGVYAATRAGASSAGLAEATSRLKVYALQPDLEARGMAGSVIEGITTVGYDGFVDLVAEHPTCQSWL
ncbi:MAG: sulfurtransferase complex subunit TusB [Caldimonas sp.]